MLSLRTRERFVVAIFFLVVLPCVLVASLPHHHASVHAARECPVCLAALSLTATAPPVLVLYIDLQSSERCETLQLPALSTGFRLRPLARGPPKL
jgi:hypothetical protein